MAKESEVLDHTLCQEMAKYVEELTTSGRPTLNPDIMKSFKKICRVSSLYCEQAYHLLITQLEKGHSEIRLSAFQMIEELFNRSHCFRELLISNFQHFLELTVETDYDNPLPPPKAASDLLKSSAYSAIQKWYDKFGEEYKRLTLGFNFLKTCKKVDFNGIRSRTELQQKQEKEKEEKLKKIAKERMEKTLEQMNEMLEDIKNTITEAKTGFQLILPSPDDFFIETGEGETSSITKSCVKNSRTATCTEIVGESSKTCTVTDGELSKSCTVTDGELSKTCTVTDGETSKTCTVTDGELPKTCTVTDGELSKTCTVTDGETSKTCTVTDGKLSKTCTVTDGELSKTCTVTDGELSKTCTVTDGESSKTCTVTDGKSSKTCTVTDGELSKTCTVTDGELSKTCTVTDGESSKTCTVTDGESSKTCTVTDGESSKTCTVTDGESSKTCTVTDGQTSKTCTVTDGESSKTCTVTNGESSTCLAIDGEPSKHLVVVKVTTTTDNDLTSDSNSNQLECVVKESSDLEINNISACISSKNDTDIPSGTLTSQIESENCCEDLVTGDKTNSSSIKGSNSVNNDSDYDNDSDENCTENEMDDDSESDEEENVLQEHGLHSFKYNLSIDMTPGVVSLQETDDNKDLLQTLKDHYRLIVTKYKPTVNKWIQNLTKYGDKEDLTKSVIDVKADLDSLLSKYNEMNIIPDDKPDVEMEDDSDDDFEDVPEKEGYEPTIPPHKRAEYGLDPLPTSTRSETVTQKPKASTSKNTSGFWSLSQTIEQKPECDPTTMKANFLRLQQQTSSTSATATSNQSKPKVPLQVSGDSQKDKLLEKAPVVPYGVDLEHWENPDKMEAPMVVNYDWLNTVWAYTERDNGESKADQDGLAALKNRSISFAGKFEAVKWKCRAPMPNGKFCERMDRFKCPFHGKIIARNDSGQPTDPKDIASLSSQHDDIDITSNDQSYWRDPELEADIEAALGIDLGSSKGKKKGKGKGKGKRKKYPNLTDITEVKNTSRNRLEKKIFKRSTMKRVAADLDELDNKKARDKFGNQFVYQMSQR